MSGRVTQSTSTSGRDTITSPTVNAGFGSTSAGNAFGAAALLPPEKTSMGMPPQKRPRFTSTKLAPMAATSRLSLLALRSGR